MTRTQRHALANCAQDHPVVDVDARRVLTAGGTPVWVSGSGPTVVLVHGVLMDHRMWAPQVEALVSKYRLCCMDMLGHGEAPDPDGPRKLDDFVSQVDEVVELFSDRGRPVLGGFSMGGLISQAYASRFHRKLGGLILLNAVYDRSAQESAIVRTRYEQMAAGGVAAALESARSRWFTEFDWDRNADKLDAILSWISDGEFESKVKAHRVFSTGDKLTAGTLGEVSCPALVMTGEDDAGSTPRMASDMAAAMPDARVEVISGQRHMMSVLAPERVNEVWLEFLSTCFPAGR